MGEVGRVGYNKIGVGREKLHKEQGTGRVGEEEEQGGGSRKSGWSRESVVAERMGEEEE